jgi:arylformamidase
LPEIKDPFMIRAHTPHFEQSVADYRASSAATRATLRGRLDVAYGDDADEKLDLFYPKRSASTGPLPIHLFVHGGYWRSFSKADYSFVADAIVAHGAIAAILDYSLMPAARMAKLVDQVRRAANWLGRHARDYGGDRDAISASGHSAGGHLAAYLVCRSPSETQFPDNPIRSALSLSGLYDLAPIAASFLQPELHLTEDEIARWSPCEATPRPDARLRLVVGGAETPPFLEQAERFTKRLGDFGPQPRPTVVPNEDHMTIVRAFGHPENDWTPLLAETIAASILK